MPILCLELRSASVRVPTLQKKDQANKQLPESRHHIERKPCIQIRYMQMPSMTPPKKNIQRKGSTSYPTSLTHLPTRAEVVKCCVQVGHAEAPRRHHKKSKAANRITLQGKRELCNTLCGTADSWSGRMGHPPPKNDENQPLWEVHRSDDTTAFVQSLLLSTAREQDDQIDNKG